MTNLNEGIGSEKEQVGLSDGPSRVVKRWRELHESHPETRGNDEVIYGALAKIAAGKDIEEVVTEISNASGGDIEGLKEVIRLLGEAYKEDSS